MIKTTMYNVYRIRLDELFFNSPNQKNTDHKLYFLKINFLK